MEHAGLTDHLKRKLLFYLNFSRNYEYFHTSKRVSVNSRLFEKMVNENWVGNFFHFSIKQGRCSNIMKLYMKLENIIVSKFFKNIGQRLTMRQVVGQIKVKFIAIFSIGCCT